MDYKILILCVTLANLCMAEQATITYISPPQTKNPDESVTFNCTVSKPKDATVVWMKDTKTLTLDTLLAFRDPRLSIVLDEAANTYSLRIQNLTTKDTGKYRCQINLDLSTTVGKEIDLQVTRPPVILDSTETNFRVKEGEAVTLLCSADGFPRPEITWRRNNEELMPTRGFNFKGANLTILQVKKEDRGHYVCEASNGIGNKVSKLVLLEVSFGPVLSAKRPKIGQKEGYEAKLICKATSYPPASISFLHKGKELNNNEHYQIEYLSSVNEITEAILTLKEVKKHHYGEYECKAKNALGDAKTTLELFEQELPNEIFSSLRQSSGHRFIGFHHIYAAICTIIYFRIFN
ncbi:lachesin-like [Chironomus tepperi]|uniref:lachesin-like n=1 Tax=Chironomus tepperi TaxID=113505 RepID=UPI00391F5182